MIPSVLKRMRSHRPQLAALVVLLAGSLVLTGLLAFQGYLAATSHREEAEKWLIEWAGRAAQDWDFRLQTGLRSSIFYFFEPAFKDPSSRIRDPVDLAQATDIKVFCPCLTPDDVRSVFVYEYEGGVLEEVGNELPRSVQDWITNALVNGPAPQINTNPSVAAGSIIGAPDGIERAVFFLAPLEPSGGRSLAYGFEIDASSLARVFYTNWRPPLLPQPIARGRSNDWFFSARITDATGRNWYQSTDHATSPFSAVRRMDQILRDLEVSVAVRPHAAQALLVGGLPGSRLPTLFVLLTLTAGLLGASIVLIRREADIARLRADFIAGVSHELRTPLAQIRMFSETLMLGRVRGEEERKRSLAIIDQEARRLTHLVENVLLFARAERRSGRINPERIDLAAEVRDAVHGFAILCRSQAIEIRPELQEDVGVTVDRGALRQVLLNLLDNAVKYGPIAQRVTVGMALFDGAARVWVDDEGKGIPETDRQRVFESFYRLDRDIDSAVAGSGIGLAIVRELINLHSGRVWIEDAPGGGARIVAELPGAYLRSDTAKDDWAVA